MSAWTDAGFDDDSGDVGGDIQATKSVSRRFTKTNDDGTIAMVTVYAYGTIEGDDECRDVQEMIEYLICREYDDGPIGEIWSDYRYRHMYEVSPPDLEVAFTWATNHVNSFEMKHVSWDGVTEEIV